MVGTMVKPFCPVQIQVRKPRIHGYHFVLRLHVRYCQNCGERCLNDRWVIAGGIYCPLCSEPETRQLFNEISDYVDQLFDNHDWNELVYTSTMDA